MAFHLPTPLLLGVSLFIAATGAAAPPNVIVILADDLGYADTGFNGCRDIPTPHLDALARSGVRCEAGYVTHPYCSPSRAGLLSGRHQQRFGHEGNPSEADPTQGVPVGVMLLPEMLKPAGYVSGIVGKWHLGVADSFHPLRRGFDEFFGFLGGAMNYDGRARRGAGPHGGVWRGTDPAPPASLNYLTTDFGREAAEFIKRHQARPFFLYLAFNAPHTPDQAPAERIAKFASLPEPRRTYAAMVSLLDNATGTVMAAVRDAGLEKQTLVIFLSDNGGRVTAADNAPLRGHKGSSYEGGVRVPFVVSWPGTLPAGRVERRAVSSLDIAATAVALAGSAAAVREPLEGVNLIPFITGADPSDPHAALYWRISGGWDHAVRAGDWKLCRPGLKPDGVEIYELPSDPAEAQDLAAQHPEKIRDLQALYTIWDSANVPPLWMDEHRRNAERDSTRR